MSASALSCTSLSAGYSGRAVVRGISLEVPRGEVLALLGPNGAGKTTTLMTLAGLLPSVGGTVAVGGTSLPSGRSQAAVKAGVVLVPDDRALFTSLSVRDNLRLASRRGGTSIDQILTWFPALQPRLKVAAGQLSGGEQQMLAIGRSLLRDPKVLLVDELSMGLAPVIVEQLMGIIRRIATDTGAGVVLVEQHVGLVLRIADRAVVLAHGEVVLQDSAPALAANPARLEGAYLGQSDAAAAKTLPA